MKIKNLKNGQAFTMVLKNKHGQVVHTAGSYTKIDDSTVRCMKDSQPWSLNDCGLTSETEITGTVWGV